MPPPGKAWGLKCHVRGRMLNVEVERETDDRWIAEVAGVPGAMACGATQEKAIAVAKAIAVRELETAADDLQSSPDVG